MAHRMERDSLGEERIPRDKYYGIVTQRVKEFNVSDNRAHREFIKSLGLIKKAYTNINIVRGGLDRRTGRAIISACDRVIKGDVDDHFALDIFQAGSSFDSNANEVISNIALKKLGRKKGDYSIISPDYHITLSQESNIIVTAAMKMTLLNLLGDLLQEMVFNMRNLQEKSLRLKKEIKPGRIVLKNANPLTYGQVFGSYYDSLKRMHGILSESRIGLMKIGTDKEVVRELKKYTGFSFQHSHEGFSWDMDSFLGLSSSLKDLAEDILDMANDLIELNEGMGIVVPYLRFGNSKTNSALEYISMIAHNVMGSDYSINRAIEEGRLDLNTLAPFILFNLTESIGLLGKGLKLFREMNNKVKLSQKGLEPFEEDVSYAMALSPYLGEKIITEAMRISLKKGERLREFLIRKKILTNRDFELLLTSKPMRPRSVDERLLEKAGKSSGLKAFKRQINSRKTRKRKR